MNILFITKKYPNFGGIEVVTTQLANHFTAVGHKVHIASFIQGRHKELLEALSSDVNILELSSPILRISNIKKLKSYLKYHDIDIIVNQWGIPFQVVSVCYLAGIKTKCKIISVLHGAPDTTKMIIKAEDRYRLSSNRLSKSINRLIVNICKIITRFSIQIVYKLSNKYVVLSERFIYSLIQFANLKNSKKIVAIGNPLTVSSEGYTYNPTEKKKEILYVGRMDYENKRVNRIVEAWEELFAQYPDWKLILVGKGPHKSYLENYVRDHMIQNVSFYDFQKEPPILHYKQASILMLTSDLEGFGLVIIEGMSFGVVPIVYGSYLAVYDIINSGTDGFITPMPYTKQETINKLKYLMDNQDELNRMAVNAIKKSRQFTMESISEKWISLFNTI